MGRGGGGAVGSFGWGCATRTPEPITYTRPSSAQLRYPVLDQTSQIPLHHRVTFFQKLLRSTLSMLSN